MVKYGPGLGLHVKSDGQMYREIYKARTKGEAVDVATKAMSTKQFQDVKVKKMEFVSTKEKYWATLGR